MRVKAIDSIRMTDDDGRDLIMEADDVKTVGANAGALICSQGWGEDVDGKVPTGEKSRDSVTVLPQNVVSPQSAK